MKKYSKNYDQDKDQWFVERQGREYAPHCGESFQLFIGRKPTPCQLALAERWYVIIGIASFDLRVNEQYTIQL